MLWSILSRCGPPVTAIGRCNGPRRIKDSISLRTTPWCRDTRTHASSKFGSASCVTRRWTLSCCKLLPLLRCCYYAVGYSVGCALLLLRCWMRCTALCCSGSCNDCVVAAAVVALFTVAVQVRSCNSYHLSTAHLAQYLSSQACFNAKCGTIQCQASHNNSTYGLLGALLCRNFTRDCLFHSDS